MNVNDIRIAVTVVSFLVFIGIVVWAYSGRRKQAFDEAAQLPFSEVEFPPSQLGARHREGEEEGEVAVGKVAEGKTP